LVEHVPGEAEDGPAGLGELVLSLPVVFEGGPVAVGGVAVDFDE